MGLLAHSWFEIMEFHQILIIPAFWHWKMAALRKWSNFSKKRQYFWMICVESNLTFCRKEIWSFLKVLDYQILEELINLRLKCSFLSLVQVTPRALVTPFYGTKLKFMISTCYPHPYYSWLAIHTYWRMPYSCLFTTNLNSWLATLPFTTQASLYKIG